MLPPWKGLSKRLPEAWWLRLNPSSILVRMEADGSARMRHILLKIRLHITNLVHIVCMMLLPTVSYMLSGLMIKNKKQGWAVFAAMGLIFLVMLTTVFVSEYKGVPALETLGVHGNMEGKEVRFGISESALFTAATTAATTGTVNNMHESLTPMGGFVPLAEMMLNNVFGGKGVGLLKRFIVSDSIDLYLRSDGRTYARIPGQEN